MVWSATLAAGLTAVLLSLSLHVEGLWWLGWIAMAPLLRLAFGQTRLWTLAVAALAAGALTALLVAWSWLGVLDRQQLAALLALSGLGLAGCTMAARLVASRLGPWAGPPMFGAAWAVWDFVAASGPDGLIASPAASQVPMPLFIQSAALLGPWVITFALGTVAGYAALAFSRRDAQYLLPAALVFLANALAGTLFPVPAAGGEREIALLAVDPLAGAADADRADLALGAVLTYAVEVRAKAAGADAVVLPDRIAVLRPAWRDAAVEILRGAARASGATIVAGFELRGYGAPTDAALTISPDGSVVQTPAGAGRATQVVLGGDLAHGARMRRRADASGIWLVPAWDFGGADGVMQAHAAILTAVESGMALARTARDGRLTLADASGVQVLGRASGAETFSAIRRYLPAGRLPGATLYDRIGDAGALGFAVMAVLLLALAILKRRLDAMFAGPSDLREAMWDRMAAPYGSSD